MSRDVGLFLYFPSLIQRRTKFKKLEKSRLVSTLKKFNLILLEIESTCLLQPRSSSFHDMHDSITELHDLWERFRATTISADVGTQRKRRNFSSAERRLCLGQRSGGGASSYVNWRHFQIERCLSDRV